MIVSVQRYWCKHYEQPVDSDMSELFYEDCLYGKLIVDLCLYHVAKNSFNRVERILHTHYGIQVDRDTVQRYAELFAERIQDRHARLGNSYENPTGESIHRWSDKCSGE